LPDNTASSSLRSLKLRVRFGGTDSSESPNAVTRLIISDEGLTP